MSPASDNPEGQRVHSTLMVGDPWLTNTGMETRRRELPHHKMWLRLSELSLIDNVIDPRLWKLGDYLL